MIIIEFIGKIALLLRLFAAFIIMSCRVNIYNYNNSAKSNKNHELAIKYNSRKMCTPIRNDMDEIVDVLCI